MSAVARNRSPLQIGLAVMAALALGAGGLTLGFLLFILSAGVISVGIGLTLTTAMVVVLSLVFVQGVGCAGVALAYVRLRPRIAPKVNGVLGIESGASPFSIDATVPDVKDVIVVAGGYVAAIGGAVIGGAILSTLDLDTGQNAAAQIGMENPSVLLLLIPASILLIGPGEELLFRGVVQGRLREVFGPGLAIGLASVVFAGLHWVALTGGSPAGNLAALGVLLVPAIVLGAAYEYTGNIVVPALIHGFYNATLFTLLYVVVVYGDQIVPPEAVFF